MKLRVKSTVIDWQKQELEITDTEGLKHTLTLCQEITVTMVGYPEREQKSMLARDLGQFMSRGYIIEEIGFEETPAEAEQAEDDQQHSSMQTPDIDLEYIASLWPAAMAMATRIRRDEEVELEHTLAALAQDFLVARGAISEEQRALVQMEVQPLEGLPGSIIAYVRPGAQETPEHPRLIMCTLRKDGWHLSPMPHDHSKRYTAAGLLRCSN